MDVNVVIRAEERLLAVLERLAMTLEHKVRPAETTPNILAKLLSDEEPITDPSDLPDAKAADAKKKKKKQHLHYGKKADGTIYTKWTEMSKALDAADMDVVKSVLAKYSDDGTYGGVAPANWDKVIKACQPQKASLDMHNNAPGDETAEVSETELRTICTKAKAAGIDVQAHLTKVTGLPRPVKVKLVPVDKRAACVASLQEAMNDE